MNVILGYNRRQSRQGIAALVGLTGGLGGPGLIAALAASAAGLFVTRDLWDDFLSKYNTTVIIRQVSDIKRVL